MSGSPSVQHYKMEVCRRSRDQTSLPESHVTEDYIFLLYYHKKSLKSWPPLEGCSLLRLQPLGTADETHRFRSPGFHIRVEIFWVYVHGRIDKYRERMTVLVCSCFRTLCPILTSLLCLPQTMGAEFSAPSRMLIWALMLHWLGVLSGEGRWFEGHEIRSLHHQWGTDPLLETQSISQFSSMLVKI